MSLQIAMQSLWNIKIAVLVKPEHENRISHVGTSSVKTGIANTLGKEQPFREGEGAVLCSHATKGPWGSPSCSTAPPSASSTATSPPAMRRRPAELLRHLPPLHPPLLVRGPQLPPGHGHPGEEEVTFPPTYRYERGSRDTYVWHKQKPTGVRTNVPSWCDRILWKSYPETHINSTSYGCTDDIMSSDHSPVFAAFEVGVTSQFVSKKGLSKSSDQAYIEFESIEAIVKTASRTKFFIEFYSTCLEEFKKSFENDSQSSDNINFLKVQWSSRQLPTCVIALKSMIGSTAQQFLTYLSHRGEETGNIRGSMRVRVPAERMGTRERLYEWISVDKDETGAAKGKLPHLASRTNLEHSKSVGRKHSLGEGPTCPVGKLLEEQEKPSVLTTSRPPAPHRGTSKEEASQGRSKQEGAMDTEGPPLKNSFNNPAYYVGPGLLDDRSCSVLQMAKTLSEVEYSSGGGLGREQAGRPPSHPLSKVRLDLPHRCLPPDYSRPGGFPARSIRESIEEAEER
ncbi:Phosphatidylinositol-3,4,5-trisphosphate 5-phosphatase 2, partial [Ophiophagus hannah]